MPAFFLGEFGDRHQTSKKANLGTGTKLPQKRILGQALNFQKGEFGDR